MYYQQIIQVELLFVNGLTLKQQRFIIIAIKQKKEKKVQNRARKMRGGGTALLHSSPESIHPLSEYVQLSLKHMFRFSLNGKIEHLTTHLHIPRTTRSPLLFWSDRGIVPVEPFFIFIFISFFSYGGLEKAIINRIFLILN